MGTSMKIHAHLRTTLAIAVAGALTLAACGGSSSSSGSNRQRNAALSDVNLEADSLVNYMATGCENNIALMKSGELISWGAFGDAPTKTARLVSSSCWNAVAITPDNQYKIWGAGDIVGAGTPAGIDFSEVKQIATSWNYGLALDNNGKLTDWGDNSTSGEIPTNIASLTIKKFALGSKGVLVIDSDNHLHSWFGPQDPLGAVPAELANANIVDVKSGFSQFAALTSDGKLFVWDSNDAPISFPDNFANGTYTSVSLSVVDGFGIAVDTDGKMVIWGDDPYISPRVAAAIPTWIDNSADPNNPVESISIGLGSVFVQFSWGIDSWSYGQETNATLPYILSNRGSLNPIAAGGSHTFAIDDTYSIVQLDDSKATTTLPEGNDFIALAAGLNHGLAIRRDGTLAGWSDSQYDGTIHNARTAAQIPEGITNVTHVAAGYNWSIAVSDSTTLHQWGSVYSPVGPTTPAPTNNRRDYFSLKATYNHAVALVYEWDSDTTKVISWGDNSAGQTNVPANLAADASDVIDVAAGYNCSAALHEDGTITVWGSCSGYASLKNPPTVTGSWHIELGVDFGAVMGGGNGVTVWGENSFDYQTIPTDADRSQFLAVGRFHIVTSSYGGNVLGWGDNSQNQTTIPESLKSLDLNTGFGGMPEMTDEEWLQYIASIDAEAAAAAAAANGTSASPVSLPSVKMEDGSVSQLPPLPEVQPAPAPAPVQSDVKVVKTVDPSVAKVGTVVSAKSAVAILGVSNATKVSFGKVDAASAKNCSVTAKGIKVKKAGSCVVTVKYTAKKKSVTKKVNIVVTP